MTERAFVVGDTHMGAGKNDFLEDFNQDAEFARWVGEIARSDTTLFLNGDLVDFAQIEPFGVPKPMYLLWDEAASVKKLETALEAHAVSFAALKQFIRDGGRLKILNGNHDFDFAWPSVQARVRQALGDPTPDRLQFVIGADRFHDVHIEHGYEFTPENCPRAKEFIHEWSPGPQQPKTKYLERVWGTDFMLRVYNEFEEWHPYADNVKPTSAALFQGLKHGWLSARELVRALVFLKKRGIPWGGLTSAALGVDRPGSVADIAGSFGEEDWELMLADRMSDPEFVKQLQEGEAALEPQERAIVGHAERVDFGVDTNLVGQRGSTTLGLFREDRERRAARDRLKPSDVNAVVFGHTHRVTDGNKLEGDLQGRHFNPGTWLPRLDLDSPAVREKIKEHGGLTLELLDDHDLYRSDRFAVSIEADSPRSRVQLVTC